MSIIKNTFTYTAGTLLAQFFGIFTSLATRKYLTPELMGIWSLMLLILNYLSFGHCGIFTAVEVRIPYLRGKGEEGEISHIRNIAFVVSVILSSLVLVSLITTLIFYSHKLNVSVISGLKWIVLIGIATVFYNLYVSFLRADKSFTLISVATIINAAGLLAFTLTLGMFFGLNGIYCATFLATLISVVFLLIAGKYRLHWSIEFARTKQLFIIGFPILVFGFIYTLFISLDKVLIIKMLGAKALGLYSIAILAFTYANTMPKLFSIVIFPSMQERLGRTGLEEGLVSFIKKPSIVMSYLFPPMLVIVYYLLPIIVDNFIPRYSNGILSMQILLIGCYFISFAHLPQNIIVSLNKQVALIPLTMVAAVFGVLLSFAAIKLGYGIEGVAAGSSCAYFIYFSICFYYALKISNFKENNYHLFLRLCLPFAASVLITILTERLILIPNILISTSLKLLIYLVFYILFLLYIDRNVRIFSFIITQIRKNKLAPNEAIIVEAINEA